MPKEHLLIQDLLIKRNCSQRKDLSAISLALHMTQYVASLFAKTSGTLYQLQMQ